VGPVARARRPPAGEPTRVGEQRLDAELRVRPDERDLVLGVALVQPSPPRVKHALQNGMGRAPCRPLRDVMLVEQLPEPGVGRSCENGRAPKRSVPRVSVAVRLGLLAELVEIRFDVLCGQPAKTLRRWQLVNQFASFARRHSLNQFASFARRIFRSNSRATSRL